MKCSKCWLRQYAFFERGEPLPGKLGKCLDVKHMENVKYGGCKDTPCPAVRAILKLARRMSKSKACHLSEDKRRFCDTNPYDSMIECVPCLARWATR